MAKWLKENNQDLGIKIILFLLSPFFSLIYSLKKVNTKSSYILFFLFAVLFGLCFITADGRNEEYTGDATVYRQLFELFKYDNLSDLRDNFNETISMNNERNKDIYLYSMIYLASRFSYNYHVFFMLLAVVFAFFMLKSMKFLTEEDSFTNTFTSIFILFMFIFMNGIYNINGCRFWTASWITIYAIFQIFRNNHLKYLLLIAITPLIHYSYWFIIIVLLVILLTKSFNNFWKVIFFISFFISSFAIEFVVDLSNYLPSSLQFLIERYTTEEAIESMYKTNLYQVIRRWFKLFFNIYINYIVYLFMKNERLILSNNKTKNIYRFLLIYMTIVNSVMLIPSLGVRFQILSLPFIAYLWIVVFESQRKYRKVLLFFPIVSLMYMYERLVGYVFHSVDFSFYYTSPIIQIIRYLV